ncbi:flavodoxin domain-containing protein [Flavitalea sp.]|nr:flavodoxin domain-containing protein [Flavitalea sp.]
MKGLIIYKSIYGATACYAEMLSRELDLPVIKATDVNTDMIAIQDFLVIGGSIYMGKFTLKGFLKKHSRILQTKKVFVFFVSATSSDKEAHNKAIAADNIPPLMFEQTESHFLQGKLIHKELSWKDLTLLRIGAILQKNPIEKANMLTEFNKISFENVEELVHSIDKFKNSKLLKPELAYML